MSDSDSISISIGEVAAVFIACALMRGCYHVGSIAEKANPEEYNQSEMGDTNPTANGLWPLGYGVGQ